MEYQSDRKTISEEKPNRSSGGIIWVLLAGVALVVVVLFATGFWSLDVKDSGSLPSVKMSATGGKLPDVDAASKKIVVGTTETTVEVPTIETKKKSVEVPTASVKDN